MKIDAMFVKAFTFENWTPVVDGTNVDYIKSSEADANISVTNGAIKLFTVSPLQVGSQVRNITDRNGTEVLVVNGSAYPVYVHSSDPQFNPFQELVGWRHDLRPQPPRDFLTELLATAAN